MDEKLKAYRIALIARLDACNERPQEKIEYWLTDDDVSWLKSISVVLDNNE